MGLWMRLFGLARAGLGGSLLVLREAPSPRFASLCSLTDPLPGGRGFWELLQNPSHNIAKNIRQAEIPA